MLSSHSEREFSIRSSLVAVLITWILVAAFVGINHSIPRSTDRFADILEHTDGKNLFKEYNLLSAYAKDNPSIANRRFEFLQKAWEQPPYRKKDSVLTLNKLGEEYMKRGDYLLSEESLQLSLKTDNSNLYTYHFLANLYRASGSQKKTKELAEYMSETLMTNARGQMDAGQMFAESGEMGRAGQCFSKAYALDSADIFVVVNLGVYYLRTEQFKKAKSALEKATLMNPNYYTAMYNLTLTHLRLNDWNAARKSFTRAKTLADSPREKQQIQKLQRVLGETR